VHLRECSVRPVFNVLAGYFDSVLAHLTLADLVHSEAEATARVELFASSEAERLRNRLTVSSPSGNSQANGSKE
jgi:hypothetical protein